MPEYRELLLIAISLLYALLIRLSLVFDTPAMQLLEIYVDATMKEVQAEEERDIDDDSLGQLERDQRERILHRLPYALLPGSDLMRGSSAESGRSYVWPQGLDSLQSLRLRRISFSPRAVILDFGPRILTVRLINHTSAQVYSKDQWEKSLRDIPSDKELRQFKVAIALVFPTFVIAFVSADLVYEPHWYDSVKSMHAREPPPILPFNPTLPTQATDFDPKLRASPSSPVPLFLKYQAELAKFIVRRRKSAKRSEPAILVIRKNEKLFAGFGVYGSSELFGLAGINPDITEAELFDCPSRVGRLVETGDTWIRECSEDPFFNTFVRPAIHGTLLAPSPDQRLKCGKGAFRFFAKLRARVTQRTRDLQVLAIEDCKNNVPIRYDIFEPSFIRPAFFGKPVHLGELIFGSDFARTGIPQSSVRDSPLRNMYAEAGLLDAPTHLHPTFYSPAYPDNLKTGAAVTQHFAYRLQTSPAQPKAATSGRPKPAAGPKRGVKRPQPGAAAAILAPLRNTPEPQTPKAPRFVRGIFWTAYPRHPSVLQSGKIYTLSDTEMNNASFATVVNTTKQVVVGPLEWFGNGIRVQLARKTIIGVCHADPVAFPLSAKFNPLLAQIRGRIRRHYRAQQTSGNKGVLPVAISSKATAQIRAYNKARSVLSDVANTTTAAVSSEPKSIPKRRRLNIDAKIALQTSLIIPSPPSPSLASASAPPTAPLPSLDYRSPTPPPQVPSTQDEVLDLFNESDVPIPRSDQPLQAHPVYTSSGRALQLEDEDEDEEEEEDSISIISEVSNSGSEYEVSSGSSDEDDFEYSGGESSDFDLPAPKRARRSMA